ncbi:MAG TPA: hypothetical protein VH370_05195 [Humisphaera sp.]|nr:hypothetical protein [Humisphaera sp.]
MTLAKLAVLGGLGAGLAGIGTYGIITAPTPAAAADERHPLRDALEDLRRAKKDLEAVGSREPDPREHRRQALDGINLAIDQLEMATGEKPDHGK